MSDDSPKLNNDKIEVKSLGNELQNMIANHKKMINKNTLSRLKRIPSAGNNCGWFELFVDMIKDYRKHTYKLISDSTIITLIFSVLYIISPIDIIPDGIGIVGLLDDMAIIAYTIRTCYEELCAYKLWLATRDLSLKEAQKIIMETISENNDL